MFFKNTAVVALAAVASVGSVSALPQNFDGPQFSITKPDLNKLNDGVHNALASILGDTDVADNNAVLPSFSIPDFNVPDFTIPDFNIPDFTIPDFTIPSFAMPDFSNMFDGAHDALASILGDPNVMKSASQAMNSLSNFLSKNPGFMSSVENNLSLPTGVSDGGNNNDDNESDSKNKNPFATSGASGIKPLAGVVAASALAVAVALF
ncbi:hypothetical protein J3B02_006049 [Coemansia erecta]|uniref:Uncharacterized protein n=1 Tax=Coemansia asiatica TaxID=1052880 RepID=A0A9W7XDX2_9FUNG|nr:hypothetical protein LPJ64_005682 [Coemansia asiatica]KAJ2841105.1 hypothetical protein J3B02_006049 [Coemansia erecta]KAJ2860928.1 hypothetical protein FB639_005566 [Coemansia asiatica]